MNGIWSIKMDRQNRNFTLIELIVIISMIGILSSLLMSAMRHGMDQAKNLECRGNLKNLGEAIVLFTNDNNRDMPEAPSPSPRVMLYFVWDFAPYFGYQDEVYDPVEKSDDYTYLWYKWAYTVPEVFQCPFNDDKDYVSYGWNNWYMHGWGVRDEYPNNETRWKRLKYGRVCESSTYTKDNSRTAVIADQVVMGDSAKTERGSEWMGRWHASSAEVYDFFSTRHVGTDDEIGGNYLFLDGRVSWRSKSYLMSSESRANFWDTGQQ